MIALFDLDIYVLSVKSLAAMHFLESYAGQFYVKSLT